MEDENTSTNSLTESPIQENIAIDFFSRSRYKQNLVIGKVRLNLTMLDSEKVTVAIWGDGIGLFDKPNQIELRE